MMLSRARAFWRLARKAQIEGDHRKQDWYNLQAQQAYKRYADSKTAAEALR